MARNVVPDTVAGRRTHGDPVREARTSELGSEGGGYAELTQSTRAATGDNADAKPYDSSLFTFAVIAGCLILVAMLVWLASSLSF